MTQQKTELFIKICMKTWLLCETCVHAEETSAHPRYDLISECTACARSCFALVSKLVADSDMEDMGNMVWDCMLHCRQCAQECSKYTDNEDLELCADVCEVCGDSLRELTRFSLN